MKLKHFVITGEQVKMDLCALWTRLSTNISNVFRNRTVPDSSKFPVKWFSELF